MAFGRLAFADDPTTPTLCRPPRPAELATPRARVLAAGIDVTLAVMALVWSGAIGGGPVDGSQASGSQASGSQASGSWQLVHFLVWVAVLIGPVLMEATGGQTLGKRMVGIRVVSRETGGSITLGVAAHRAGARALFWFIGFLALGDPLLQPLHDRSAGTVVINADEFGWLPPPDAVIRPH
jgi:uncharacterized RDD family membrane protein YckC